MSSAEMVERRKSGESYASIGRDFGVSGEWVRRVCAKEDVSYEIACRRCGDTFEAATAGAAPVCPSCRGRHCIVCGEPFSRDQWRSDDGEAHASCRRGLVVRGASGGTTFRSVETGIYRRIYKTTGITLDGYYVGVGNPRRLVRCRTLREARLAQKAARE